ncbi:protein O-mannosyl-transferase TMTC2 [Ciona intestinalis]
MIPAEVVVCGLTAVLVYWNTFQADFVYDDLKAIVNNPDVTQASPIANIFKNDFWGTPLTHTGSHRSYRPLTTLTFRFNHCLFGLSPGPYHVTNVLLHCVVTMLFCHVIKIVLNFTSQMSMLAGLMFSLHPVHTEAVAGIVGRADVLATLFTLSALWIYACVVDSHERSNTSVIHQKVSYTPGTLVKEGREPKKKSKTKRRKSTTDKSREKCETFVDNYYVEEFKLMELNNDASSNKIYTVDKSVDPGYVTDSSSASCSVASSETYSVAAAELNSEGISNMGLPTVPCSLRRRRKLSADSGINLPLQRQHAGNSDIHYPAIVPLQTSSKRFCFLYSALIFLSACALLSKEQGYVTLPLCIVYDVWIRHRLGIASVFSALFGRDPMYKTLRRRVWSLGFIFLASMILRLSLPVWLSGGGDISPGFSASDNPAAASESFRCRALTFSYLMLFNVKLLLVPTTLSFDWSMGSIQLVEDWLDPRNLQTVTFYAILMTLNYRLWTKLRYRDLNNRVLRSSSNKHESQDYIIPQPYETKAYHQDRLSSLLLGFLLLFLSLLPASNLFFYVGFVVAERVLYLPSIGSCILITEGAFYLFSLSSHFRSIYKSKLPRSRSIMLWSLACCLLVSYAVKTFTRNEDWRNEFNLYSSGVSTNPAKAYGNLGNVLRNQQKLDQAEAAYVSALRHRSNMADVHYNLALLYQDTGRLAQAERSYRDAISYRPQLALARLNLGVVLSQLGRNQEAKRVYRETAKLDDRGLKDPRSHAHAQISALYNLGCLLAEEGNHVTAVSAYRKAIGRKATHYKYHSILNMLGQSFYQLGRIEEAEQSFKLSLAEKPDHVPSHLTYARLQEKVGKFSNAEKLYRNAIQLEPNNPMTYQHYSRLHINRGMYTEASKLLDKAIEVTKGTPDYELLFAAASAHRHAKSYSTAERYYRLAVKVKPKLASSHMNLGAILHLQGKLSEARKSYMQALSLKPMDPLVLENLEKLDASLNNKKR